MRIQTYFWIIPFFCFFLGYGIVYNLFHIDYIEMPLFVGKTIDQAIPIATSLHLNMRLLQYKEDADIPPGVIVSQIPEACKKVKPHQSIFFVVSKNPPVESTPNLQGKTEQAIRSQLSSAGITYTHYQLPSNYPQSHCIAQIPAPGEPLHKKNIIFYTSPSATSPIANQKIIWPSFINKRVEEVKEFLKFHDIDVEIIHTYTQRSDHECINCLVVDQRPLPGSIIIIKGLQNVLRVQLQVA